MQGLLPSHQLMTKQDHLDALAKLGYTPEPPQMVDMKAYNERHKAKKYMFDFNARNQERRLESELQQSQAGDDDVYV